MYTLTVDIVLLSNSRFVATCASLNKPFNIFRAMRLRLCDNWSSLSWVLIPNGGISYDNVIIATKLLRIAGLRSTTFYLNNIYLQRESGSGNQPVICKDLFIYSYWNMLIIQNILNREFYFNKRGIRQT